MSELENIGKYKQLMPFTNENAGTSEWCKAEKDGKIYFVKKLMAPVYPSKDIGLPEHKYQARMKRFHEVELRIRTVYDNLRKNDTAGTLVVPFEVMVYQYHITTITDFVKSNLNPADIHKLSEWQRVILMRTLTLSLMNVHKAGVVHSDMKPENVLIIQNPDNGGCILKLIDFDGSWLESNPPKEIKGDQAYFPPEVYQREMDPDIHIDHKIDIFALALLLHLFWKGKLPNKPEGLTVGQALMEGHSVELDSGLPTGLRDIIIKAMQPAENRCSCEEIYDALGTLMQSYPVKLFNLETAKLEKIPLPVPPAPSESIPSNVEFLVEFVDNNGFSIYEAQIIKIKKGSFKKIYAVDIPGYRIIQGMPSYYTVFVDNLGIPTPPAVSFVYQNEDLTPSPPVTPYREKRSTIVTVRAVDLNGNSLLPDKTVSIGYGKSVSILSDYIEGYQVTNDEFVEVSVNSIGIPSQEIVIFYYAKKKGIGNLVIWIWILTLAAYLLYRLFAYYTVSHSNYESGLYNEALSWIEIAPLYKYIFTDEYNDAQDQSSREKSISISFPGSASAKYPSNINESVYFRLSIPSSGRYRISAENANSGTLFDENWNCVNPSISFPAQVTFANSSNYYIKIKPESNQYTSSQLSLSLLPDNISDLSEAEKQSVYIRRNKTSYFRISPLYSSFYSIQIHNSAQSVSAILYDSYWNVIGKSLEGDSGKFFIQKNLTKSSDYYLAVSYKNSNASGQVDIAYQWSFRPGDFWSATITPDTPGGHCAYFVPAESAYYTFQSTGNFDTKGYIKDENGKELASDDDSEDGLNFSIVYYMKAGECYKLIYRLVDTQITETIYVKIEKK